MINIHNNTVLFVVLFTVLVYSFLYLNPSNIQAAQATEPVIVATPAQVTKPVIKPVDTTQLKCLAANIYHEAAGEPFLGQVAVARVVMNRVKHGFAPTPCKVIYQKHQRVNEEDPSLKITTCQFSWVCSGKSEPPRNSTYAQAEQIAYAVLSENRWSDIFPSTMLFFHNIHVDPKWPYRKLEQIGNHIFYSKYRKPSPNSKKTVDK
jgi:spore germination cell wall hydrolase CwlJ-like protein